MLKQMLTIKEVSEITRLSVATLYCYISQKRIPHFKFGSRVLFKKDELEVWISARSVKPLTITGGVENDHIS